MSTPTNPSPQAFRAAMELFPHGSPATSYCYATIDENKRAMQNYTNSVAAIIDREFAPLITERDRLRDLVKEMLPYLEDALKRNLDSLKGADAESCFYGEDIATMPLINKASAALQQTEDGNSNKIS